MLPQLTTNGARPVTQFIELGCFLSFLLSMANAGTDTFAWDANSEPNIAGHRVHYGKKDRTHVELLYFIELL